MATLANTRGSDLVAQFGDPIAQGLGQLQARRREEFKRATLEEKIKASLGLETSPVDLPKGEGMFEFLRSKMPARADKGILGQLNPQYAQAVAQARENPAQAAELRASAETGLALATELQKLPDYAARVKRLREEGGKMAGKGEDFSRIVDLVNKSPAELDLELQKMQLMGTEALRQLPPPITKEAAIASVMSRNPALGSSLLSRRDRQIAEEQARRAAAARAAAANRAAAAAADDPKGPLAVKLAQIERERGLGNYSSDPAENTRIADGLRAKALSEINPPPADFKPQSPAGKTVADMAAIDELYGENSPQAIAFKELNDPSGSDKPPSLSNIAGARKEFTALSGDFVTMRNAVNKVNSAIDSGAGDVSLVFNYMKILDPNSVVRESEFATAENTAGIPERIIRTYNNALTGERLTEKQREEFVRAANILFDTQVRSQRRLEDSFRGIAARANMDPNDVVIDFIGNATSVESPQVQSSAVIPEPIASNPVLLKAAKRNGVSVQEILDNLSDDAKKQLGGGQ